MMQSIPVSWFFFFQAEDGIRDLTVTGVQTCALPICAGGAIGYKYVASQKPDGYSVVWNSNSISTTYHSGLLPFDYHEFDAVARVLVESPVIAVRGESKWKTLGQLVADAKSHPKGITVGNSGIGSHTHISSVALFKAAGVEVVDVPFGA